MKTPAELKLDDEKLQTWLKNGAQPTETVKSLIAKNGNQ
jgi:small subunit ribosomal protein S16